MPPQRKRGAEVERLKAWCLAVQEFMFEKHPPPAEAQAVAQAGIAAAIAAGRMRDLRMFARELLDDAKHLPPAEREELDRLLRARLGAGLDAGTGETKGELDRVLRRGRIANEREYRLLLDRAEEIHLDTARNDELSRINELLAAYRARK